jgi:hypothetical protein
LAGNDEAEDKPTTLVPVSAFIISIVTAIIQSGLTQLQDTAPPKSRYTAAIAAATSIAEAAYTTHSSEKLLGRDVGDLIGTSINRRGERDQRGAAFWPFQSTRRTHIKKVQSQAHSAFGLIALEGLRAFYAGARCTSMY